MVRGRKRGRPLGVLVGVRPFVFALALALAAVPRAPQAFAGPATSASAPVAAAPADAPATPPLPADAELPPLPSMESVALGEPTIESTKELESLLGRLASAKADVRERARADLADPPAAWVPAIHARIQEIREALDRDRAPRVLEDARKRARDDKKQAKKKGAPEEDDDWLLFVHARPSADDETWVHVVELLGMVRLLGAIGTTPATRELLSMRAAFGEMLRIDLSRQVQRLGDRAVPALLEARRHDAVIVQRFAELELDKLGRVTPGEAVAVRDPDVLADVLRAFGRTRDVDAVGVLLSFANHDRKKVRLAAREGLVAVGEPGRWQLRDALQDLTGDKVDKNVKWDVLARRIFWLYDQSRVAELVRLAEDGFRAAGAAAHADAVAAFDKVLARDPLFDGRERMAPSYFDVARAIPMDRAEERLAMLRKARRLAPASPDGAKWDAEIAFVEAELLAAEGRPDRSLLERALALDPGHAEARARLDAYAGPPAAERKQASRWIAAGGAGAATLLALLAFALFGRRKKAAPPAAPPSGEASEPAP